MIVWAGRGIFSLLVLIGVYALCRFLLQEEHYSESAYVIAAFSAGLFSWIFGTKWNNRVITDEKGQQVIVKSNHGLFWIKMQYWGIIFPILGIIMLAQKSIGASVIAAVIFLLTILFLFMRNKKKVENKSVTIVEEVMANMPFEESEEDRLKRKQEKEDLNRFMPQ